MPFPLWWRDIQPYPLSNRRRTKLFKRCGTWHLIGTSPLLARSPYVRGYNTHHLNCSTLRIRTRPDQSRVTFTPCYGRPPEFQLSCVRLCCWSYSFAHQFPWFKFADVHAPPWIYRRLSYQPCTQASMEAWYSASTIGFVLTLSRQWPVIQHHLVEVHLPYAQA